VSAGKRFTLTKFDKDLLGYLSDGPSSRRELLAKTRVAESEFDKRIKKLKAKKYVVLDGDGIALGVGGYNKSRQLDAAARRKETKKERVMVSLPEAKPAPKQEPKTEPVKPERVEAPANAIDLAEILKQASERMREQKGVQQKSIEKEPWPPKRVQPKESCELCKGEFFLSVKGGHPKYGHCFCGAAYHKDCYEAVVGGGKHWVRCGRKAELYLDKESEEAVHSIRDVFD